MSPANVPLWARGTASELESVPSTFSSWDKCMAKSYCKWPVIAGIIVGSVILLAVLACVVNCICCGYQCCKCCCSCCCPSGRRRNKQPKQPKHFDDPPFHQPPPPDANPIYQASPAPPSYRGAQQTARFDTPKSPAATVATANDDALPEMPTWAGAVNKHVEDPNHHDDVEMEPLNPPDRKGAGTPGVAYSDYSPNPAMAGGGYRGFGPTDPYARRSPGPAAALAATQDPYGRRSPGVTSPGGPMDPYARRSPGPAALSATQDPYGRRSPGPAAALAATQDPYGRRSPGVTSPAAAAAVDPYARRSPGPGAAYAAAQDPYNRRSPGLTSPVGAPVHNPYDQSYDDHSTYGSQYHAVTSPSPVAAYKPHTTYSPVPMSFTPSSEMDHGAGAAPTPGFTRQPSFGSSQYPPTYTSQPASAYRAFSPTSPASPPPPFPAPSPSEYTTYNPHAISSQPAAPEPDTTRPPSLLQSGPKPNAAHNF
ncbi:hypothetical protein N7522_012381 [Penicillium canescens]|uniref:Fibroin-3 related protein n=1 Tax=Penicillium canescens TaxID=5083 RepID=A0AAD6N2C2_PENCN|nr:uncharacterized protein N7446_013573 [Penicillium canescens]KAJ5985185.1 hypothetical protein N7522_012381 [Penicillium canescens]KAJ6023213.1 hypothetical protein N7460_013608 [Penicillium canescens]KAJ6025518.1 hypothetical protein N7444_013197 [Penicillium canescens]KAJ6042507.1 hypothetical protein N7446_013573 [Penicillium canescens]